MTRSAPRSRRTLSSDATRAALLAAARRRFARRGYDAVTAEEIARAAGVTRATLYYQFRDKGELFRAVCEELERECSERIAVAAAPLTDPWQQVRAGCSAALDTYLDPAYQRIMVRDAPAVLGWTRWRALLARYGRGLLREGVRRAMEQGSVERRPLEPLVHLITGAINEAGLAIAHAKDPRAARAQLGSALDRLLEGVGSETGRGRRAG